MISRSSPKAKPLRASEVEKQVRALLALSGDDVQRRADLETLARAQPAFAGLTWLWGPELYRRNRLLFRPFILSHFASWQFDPPSSWKNVYWKGDIGARLDDWLRETDRLDDVPLFRRLYQWKISSTSFWKVDPTPLIAELKQRFAAAASSAERAALTLKFDLWFELDEPSAIELYRLDKRAAGPYILKHLPNVWSWWGGAKRQLWKQLYDTALAQNDSDTANALFRKQAPLDEWQKRVEQLCKNAPRQTSLVGELRVGETADLCDQLEKIHPEGWGLNLGDTFARMLMISGLDAWPYIRRHLFQIHQGLLFKTAYDTILEYARGMRWWQVWAALLKTRGGQKEFNREINLLLQDQDSKPEAVQERLLLLTGVAQEWNFGGFGMAQIKPLDDDTALAMYEKFPHLLRGPFRKHLVFTYGLTYPRCLDRFIAAHEDDLIDYLASRAATRLGGWGGKDAVDVAEKLSAVYEALRDNPTEFARRSASVLGQIPAFAIYGYGTLIQKNRLARLLFERSLSSWLDDQVAVTNLVEASEIHVQQLSYRVLGQRDPRAPHIAHANLPLLLGTLLRPLHRRTRTYAFSALENAAIDSEAARLILDKARQALDLPDTHYPKEALLGLMARLLHRWPSLRENAEQPTVYRIDEASA
ncbi:MAG TPA: gliding motility protein [Candidatus Ozemobacteraceae bacterium]|nr:gliding motility protein [Candidatus Ozemobacteraceae bacterium]